MPAADHPARPSREFSDLLSEHQGRIYALILTLVYDPGVADEVLQETNEILWEKAEQFELGTNFRAWAFRVARLRVKTHRRSAARDPLVFDDELVGQLAADVDRVEDHYAARRRRLRHCLGRLPEGQRGLVLERYVESETVASLADSLGQTANSVSQALFRARRALMDCVRRETRLGQWRPRGGTTDA